MDLEIMNTPDTELFLPEEMRILNKTLRIREEVVDELVKDGVPTNSRDIRVLNEVLNAMDANVLGRVDRRLKKQEEENNGRVTEMVKELLINLSKEDTVNVSTEYKEIELNDDTVIDLVPGEDKIGYEEISIEEIRSQ